MIQKRTFNTSTVSKLFCFVVIFILSVPFTSVISKENESLSSKVCVYSGDDAEILLSEGIVDDGYVINLEFAISNYYSESIFIDGDSYLSLSLGDSVSHTTDIGKPTVPTIRKLIAIPHDSSYSLKIQESNYENIKLDDNKVLPLQTPTYDCEVYIDDEFTIDNTFYNSDSFYPSKTVSVVKDIVFRDFNCILLQFNPVMYNPARNEIRFYNNLDVRLEFNKEPMCIKESRTLDDIYDGIVLNYDSAKNWPSFKSDRLPGYDDYDFLIITDDQFYDSMIPFKQSKEQSGIETRIVKTSETGTSASSIKNYIKDAYNNEGIGYVLLVGDDDHIPIQQDGDHYYTCLDGSDLYPEIAIGRFSVKTNQDVNNIVQKTIDYGFFSSFDDQEKNILLVAHPQNAPGKYQGCKEFIDSSIIPSEMNVNKVYPYEGGTKQNVIDYMNDGQLIVNYRGHGATTFWDDPRITSSDLTSLNNAGKLPLIFSIACNNGEIKSECIAEKSHRDESSCIGYLAASKPSPTIENHEFDKDLFRAIFDHEKTVIGDIIFHAKSALLEDYPAGADVKMYILFGDPTTELQGGGPRLSLSPSSYDFGDMYKDDVGSTSFEICNSGSETLTYSLYEDCSWLDVSSLSGSLSEGEKDTININIDTAGLIYGNNTCSIDIESNDKPGVFEISVNVVSRPPDNPSDPMPSVGAMGVGVNPTFLGVNVSDPDLDSMSVSFFNAVDDVLIDSVRNIQSGETAIVEWPDLSFDTSYSWYVVANDSLVETKSSVFSFTTNSPPVLSNVYPENGSVDVSLGLGSLSLDIVDPDGDNFDWSITTIPDIGSSYIGDDFDGGKTCEIIGLLPNTDYVWTVTAIDSGGAMIESVFSFKTRENMAPGEPVAVYPLNSGVDVGIICTLNWSCVDPDGNTDLVYDVYFGTDSNPSILKNGVTDSFIAVPYDLELSTKYYWKVVATDNYGASTESDVFSFTTSSIPPPPAIGSLEVNFPRKICWSGIKTSVLNKGSRDASNVLWDVSVSGGVIDRLDMSMSGCIERLDSGESQDISTHAFLDFSSKRVLGLGRVEIRVKTSNVLGEVIDSSVKDAFVFGPLILFLD